MFVFGFVLEGSECAWVDAYEPSCLTPIPKSMSINLQSFIVEAYLSPSI